ncbi:MAG TPA: hypothetical protein VIH63_09140, partial [Xanthobacteraceae bacterium]
RENRAEWQLILLDFWGDHFLDMEGVSGSIPLPPTILRCFAATAGKPISRHARSSEGCPPKPVAKAGRRNALS